MSLDLARTVADAVLYEGYLLYPYRSTSRKNQVRWQFGILGPPGAAGAGVGEEPAMTTECLVEGGPDTVLDVRLRFLQVQPRAVERAEPGGRFSPVPELDVDGTSWLSWEEAVEHEVDLPQVTLGYLGAERCETIQIPGGEDVEPIRAADGTTAGRVVRSRLPLTARVLLSAEPVGGALTRLHLSVENVTPWSPEGGRSEAVGRSFVGSHLLLGVRGGAFVSLLEPPEQARAAAEACVNVRCWPVLVGEEGQRDVVLVSPIILYDYPAVAPESAGDLFDSTEIDEILTLRVMTLTDEEKLAARATDPRAAAIIDRCDTMSPQAMERLHGTLRYPHSPTAQPWSPEPLDAAAAGEPELPWWEPAMDASVSPETDAVRITGVPVSKGSRVRLRPSRRADAQDLFLAGRVATVARIDSDVDGNTHVAVTLVDDPAAEINAWYGRYYYFAPDEVEPLTPEVTS